MVQMLALLVLALGLLLPGLRQGNRFTQGLFLLILVLLFAINNQGVTLYLLYLPPVVIPLLLCGVFFRGLLPGGEPLVTAIAEQVHGSLPAYMHRYTRSVTLMWAIFFAAIALWSALLPWLGSITLWSLFTNFINYMLAALLFVIEYIYRKWRFQNYDQPGFVDYLRIVVNADIRKR